MPPHNGPRLVRQPMQTAQRVIENLLLVTGVSRAVLQLARPDGTFAIEAEAVQHAQAQIRHHETDRRALNARMIETLERDQDFVIEHDIGQTHAPGERKVV